MKLYMTCCLLAALVLTSCKKAPQAQAPSASSSSAARSSVPAWWAQLPEPTGLAPGGVFFLVSKVTVETNSGILSFPAGTKVLKVGDRYVTSDVRQLKLRPEQLTNDLNVAYRVAGRDPKLLNGIYMTAQTVAAVAFAQSLAATPTPRLAKATTSAAQTPHPKLDGDARKEDESRMNRN